MPSILPGMMLNSIPDLYIPGTSIDLGTEETHKIAITIHTTGTL